MTEHSYTEKIKNELEKHDRLYFNELQRLTGIPRNTLTSRLKELKNKKEIDNEAASRNGKVVSEYFLTEYAKIKRLWKIDSHQKQDKEVKVKAFLLITYFAAFGYEDIDNKKPSEVELGDVSIVSPNNDTIEHHSLHMRKKPGVSIDDLTNKIPGINRAAIFTYMDYSEEELKMYFSSLVKQNPPIVIALQKSDDMVAIIYGIANKDLEVFIKKCWVMFYTVLHRMEDAWTYIRWPKPDSKEANWYVRFFGAKKTEKLIKGIEKERLKLDKRNEKEKQDFIDSVYNEIKLNDINIIAIYKQLLSSNYNHIRKKYHLIVNPLLETCYPYFIRILHKKNEI